MCVNCGHDEDMHVNGSYCEIEGCLCDLYDE